MDCAGYVVDPVRLMGDTGFAFRLWVEDRLSPSAMNAFNWKAELTSAVRRAGFDCAYFESATTGDREGEDVRNRAHEAIVRSIDQGIPAIAWDVNDPPMWGLIIGYNDHTASYDTASSWHYSMPLRYDQLGRRDVRRLNVIVLEEEREQDEFTLLQQALRIAVDHARGRDVRPYSHVEYGLAAYDRWGMFLQPGTLADHELQFADYYAEMYFSFRCYARDYLARWSEQDKRLRDASRAYGRVATHLGDALRLIVEHKQEPASIREQAASLIRSAAAAEGHAIAFIEAYLLGAASE
jgi:hypothetical protein